MNDYMPYHMDIKRGLFIGTLLGLLLAMYIPACSAECGYSFDEKDAGSIAAAFEDMEDCRQMMADQESLIREQETQISLMREENRALLEALRASEESGMALKEIIRAQKEQIQVKDAARPSLAGKLSLIGSGATIGAILTLIAVIAL